MELYKYPRSPHLPWSPGATSDDKFISSADLQKLKNAPQFVVTEKMDGGNLTFYKDAFHGRSKDSGTHAWDTAAKALWASVRFMIPEGWRVSGESMYARRSVAYDELPGVYLIFGAWDENNNALDWDTVVSLAEEMNVPTVPLIYRGDSWDDAINAWSLSGRNESFSEGFVVRNSSSFHYDDFSKNLAKYVRADHVQTAADWRHRDDFAVNGFVRN